MSFQVFSSPVRKSLDIHCHFENRLLHTIATYFSLFLMTFLLTFNYTSLNLILNNLLNTSLSYWKSSLAIPTRFYNLYVKKSFVCYYTTQLIKFLQLFDFEVNGTQFACWPVSFVYTHAISYIKINSIASTITLLHMSVFLLGLTINNIQQHGFWSRIFEREITSSLLLLPGSPWPGTGSTC